MTLRQHFPRSKPPPAGSLHLGDCLGLMAAMPRGCVDFVLTDPPYLAHYKDRAGRTVRNDDREDWLKPAFAGMHRLLKPDAFAVSYYGWPKIDRFMDAWKAAGFRVAGHIVFRKDYASRSVFLQYRHEQAYLLVKGRPSFPAAPPPDVIDMPYSGNKLHPTQKPVAALRPLIEAFCPPGGVVLDPFAGSASTLIAARELGRRFMDIELDPGHHATASRRLQLAERPGNPASPNHDAPVSRP